MAETFYTRVHEARVAHYKAYSWIKNKAAGTIIEKNKNKIKLRKKHSSQMENWQIWGRDVENSVGENLQGDIGK